MGTQFGRTASEAVIAAVAEEEGVNPTDLPPLYESIDTGALDSLVSDGARLIKFDYHGYSVSIDRDATVTLH